MKGDTILETNKSKLYINDKNKLVIKFNEKDMLKDLNLNDKYSYDTKGIIYSLLNSIINKELEVTIYRNVLFSDDK